MKSAVWIIWIFAFLLGSCNSNGSFADNQEKTDEQFETAPNGANDSETEQEIPVLEKLAILPVNESKGNKSLTEFIKLLTISIENKDVKMLYSLMDSNVISGHGGGYYGFIDLEHVWGDPTGDFLWDEMSRIVNLGGAYQAGDTIYRIPYCDASKFFKDVKDPDWYKMCVCLRKGVPLYKEGSVKADTIALMNYSIVHMFEYGENNPPKGFLKVTSEENGLVGFVQRKEVYRTADYNLNIEKQVDGTWRITAFAPYD